MIEKTKKYIIFIILTLIIPAFIVFFMDLLYFLFINYGDSIAFYHDKNGDIVLGKQVLIVNNLPSIYIILHIKACIVFSILALLSLISSFYYRLYGLIYIFILSISYVFANVLAYYEIINDPVKEFYFSLFISFITSSLLYSYINDKRFTLRIKQ